MKYSESARIERRIKFQIFLILSFWDMAVYVIAEWLVRCKSTPQFPINRKIKMGKIINLIFLSNQLIAVVLHINLDTFDSYIFFRFFWKKKLKIGKIWNMMFLSNQLIVVLSHVNLAPPFDLIEWRTTPIFDDYFL